VQDADPTSPIASTPVPGPQPPRESEQRLESALQQAKRAEQLLAALHAVTRLLAERTSPEEAMPRILQAICETLDWDLGLSWSVSGGSPSGRPDALWYRPCADAQTWLEDSLDPPRESARDSPWFASDLADRGGLYAAFGFAVPVGGSPWAHLAFFSREIRQPDPALLAAMTTLGSQIGQFVERRQAEGALERARAQLTHVTRVASLGELMASIVHEVNQPLTGIIANGQAAQRWLQRQPPELREADECLQRLVRDGKRAGEVIVRLRTLVRQGEKARRAPVDLSQVVRDTLPLVRSEVQQHGATIRLDLAEGLAPAFADHVQLQQVVLNLIMNALESMAAVRDRPRELLLRTAEHNTEELTITFIDSGVGINPQQATRVFDAFFTTKPHGMGMGLAISRSIVEDHGGRLSLLPTASAGSVFELSLPKAEHVNR
jgi:signal transduction histidine kinase